MQPRVLLGVALLGGLAWLAAAHARRWPGEGGTRSTPHTAAQARAEPARRLAAEGRVAAYPGAEISLSAERTGRLLRVAVVEGQRVERGALVAELDSAELRAALAEAQARVREAQAELRLAEANRTRRARLGAEGVLAAGDVDQAVRDVDTAAARLETAHAEVQRHLAQLAQTRVLAPISGTVTARTADPGEMLSAGSPIATLADLQRLRIEGEADEADAGLLRVGASVLIEVPGRPEQRWRGRVEELGDALTTRRIKPQDSSRPTDTRVLPLRVAFTDATPLRLGATVELSIEPAR